MNIVGVISQRIYTLCAALFLLGLGLQAGLSLASFKLALIFAFLFFTSPTSSHSVANAALHGGLKPLQDLHNKGKKHD